MGVLSYSALADRKRERSRMTAQTAAVVMLVVGLLFLVKYFLAPSVGGLSSTGKIYPILYSSLAVASLFLLVALWSTTWQGLPFVVSLVALAFAVGLSWVDLHFASNYMAITITSFALGVIFSTGPVGYAILLSGAYIGLFTLACFTIPHGLVTSNVATQAIILGIAYAGCLQLERQRRISDKMSVELEESNARLRETSMRDELTGLYNRRFLVEFMEGKRALSLRLSIPLSMVLIDLDHFKKINDTLGHAVGDQVLKDVSLALLEGIRESDTAARYGGEEFVLVLPQANAQNAARVVVRILERVRNQDFAGMPWKVTFSAGIAELEGSEPIEAVLERADRRLYEAKRKRNLVVSWSGSRF